MTLGDKGSDVRDGHVLVIERHDIAPGGEPAERGQVAVMPDLHIRGDQRRAIVVGHRQDSQSLTERNGGLMGHPGKLPAPYHPHPGHTGAFVHGGPA